MDAAFQIAPLHIFRIFFLVKRKDLLFQLLNDLPLLVQPEQIQLGELRFHLCNFPCDCLAALVVLLLLHHIAPNEPLGKKRLRQAGQLLLEWLPMPQLFLQLIQFFFQAIHAQFHRTPPDKCIFHSFFSECAGHIALIQHSLCRDRRLVAAQLLHRIAANDTAQKIINIAARQIIFRFQLFCQTAGQRPERLFFPQLSNIHQTKSAILGFSLQMVINPKCFLIVFRLYQQIKFLIVQVAFHRSTPALI